MTQTPDSDATQSLERALDQERALLLAGDFDTLAQVAADKEAAIERVTQTLPRPSDPSIKKLKAKLQENARLLEAAMRGFERANARLEDIRSAIGQLKTYDGQGQVSSRQTTGPSVSFKA